MKFTKYIFFISIFVFSLFNGFAQEYPPVIIKGSEIRTLKSKDTGRDYDLYIRKPSDMSGAKKYPILYLLDGQWDFKLLDSIHGGLFYDKYIPEMIIVGITYSGENPNYDGLRAMDYTPTAEQRLKGSGDAAKFLKFLKNDIAPLVEKEYQADSSKRILMGSSLGGLFTIYAMFDDPNYFYGYVAAAPAVSYSSNISLAEEKQFFEKHKDLPVRLYIGVGDSEDLMKPVKDFIEMIKSRNYKGLKLETLIAKDERHAGNKPEIFNRGLRFVFNSK